MLARNIMRKLGIGRDRADTDAPAALFDAARYASWQRDGFTTFERLIAPERCDAVIDRIDRLWHGEAVPPVSIDVWLERPDTARMAMAAAPTEARSWPYKINDMVMHDEIIRNVALDPAVCDALRAVIGDAPVAIGSLNFERGSTQRFHTDTLYMPGKRPDGMAAAWFALEDVSPDAGPLLYYPGSHAIPLYLFSDGRCYQINHEVDCYDAHMRSGCAERGLEPLPFLPKKGDVLIWHERLYHGGAAIVNPALTRKSLVVHYWRADDMRDEPIVAAGGGYYWDRPPV